MAYSKDLKTIFLILLLVPFAGLAQDSLFYQLKPIVAHDRTVLEVAVRFRVDSNDSIRIGLIADNYGTPSLYKYITEFTGLNGTGVKLTNKNSERMVFANEAGEVHLKYVISIDPKNLEGYAFAPVLHADYFDIAGCQWLLHIGDDRKQYYFSIDIIDEPTDWIVHSSLGQNTNRFEELSSFKGLIESRFGGGGKSYHFEVNNRPVVAIIKGNFEIPSKEIFASVEQVIRLQRGLFNDYSQPFFQVVINARNGVIAGTAVPNAFVCFVGPKTSQNELNYILAHEMFHYWLPGKIDIELPSENVEAKHEWFTEGFTTYFARKILLDAGLLTSEEFIDLFNKDIIKIADNPYRNITFHDLTDAIRAGEFTSDLKNLAYHRGALMALNWELRLKALNKPNLSHYLQRLLDLASNQNGAIDEQSFLKFTDDSGISTKKEFNTYILDGETIRLDTNIEVILGDQFKVSKESVRSFDPGFDIAATYKSKKIAGVVKGGNAFRAGLRNGMSFVKMRNSTRNQGWSEDRLMVVTVKIDGDERDFEFIPLGKDIRLRLMQSLE